MFKKAIAAVLVLAFSAPVFAADYYLVVPLSAKAQPVSKIQVSLNGLSMPNAEFGAAYSFDLKPALSVTGDPQFNGTGVTWSVVSTTLPAGLALQPDGIITGVPTAPGQGAITVRAGYKNKAGEQTYQLLTADITVALADASLPLVNPGVGYSFDFSPALSVSASEYRAGDATWSASGVPAGMTLNAAGVLSGVATGLSGSGANISVTASYRTRTAQRDYKLSVGDPHWAQTVALLRMDGANGSTSFVDVKGGAYTAQGATISTADAKSGQSAYFPGGTGKGVIGPAISLPADFTTEGWIKPTTVAGVRILWGQWSQISTGLAANLLSMQDGQLVFSFMPYSSTSGMLSGGSVPANKWSHVAVTRKGVTFRMFVDGVLVATRDFSSAGQTVSTPFALGDYYNFSNTFGVSGARSFQGHIDEFRVTKASRYNANFTPAGSPHPAQ